MSPGCVCRAKTPRSSSSAPGATPASIEFLAKRGNAMHHIAILVSDINKALERIKDAGLRLIDQEPRIGALGHLVAFLHPKAMAGTLVELVQESH